MSSEFSDLEITDMAVTVTMDREDLGDMEDLGSIMGLAESMFQHLNGEDPEGRETSMDFFIEEDDDMGAFADKYFKMKVGENEKVAEFRYADADETTQELIDLCKKRLMDDSGDIVATSDSSKDCVQNMREAADGFVKNLIKTEARFNDFPDEGLAHLKAELEPVFIDLYNKENPFKYETTDDVTKELMDACRKAVMDQSGDIVKKSGSSSHCVKNMCEAVEAFAQNLAETDDRFKDIDTRCFNALETELTPVFEDLYNKNAKKNKGKKKKRKKKKYEDPNDLLGKYRISEVCIKGVNTKMISCAFDSKDGPIGVSFQTFKHGYYVTDVKKDSQADKLKVIQRGMLIYEISNGKKRISGPTAPKVVKQLIPQIKAGAVLIFKFLIVPFDLQMMDKGVIPQHVMVIHEKKKKTDKLVGFIKHMF